MLPVPKRLRKARTVSRKQVEYAGPIFYIKGSYERGDSPHLCFQPRRGQDARVCVMMELLYFMREGSKVRWALRKQISIDSGHW